MKIFLKLLPYLIIVALGFGIYFGFTHMSGKIAESERQNQCLIMEKQELENQVKALKEVSALSVEQLESLRKSEKESLKYINEKNSEINALTLTEEPDIMLIKINAYEECIAKNSLNPGVICKLELQ
jgi:hypothetical protein